MKKWKPSRPSLGIARRTTAPISKFIPPISSAAHEKINDAFELTGSVLLSGLAFATLAPECLVGSSVKRASPEMALGVSLGLEGLFWLLTGENWNAIAAAATSVALYGLCKYKGA